MEDIDYTESPVFSSQLLPPLVGADVFLCFRDRFFDPLCARFRLFRTGDPFQDGFLVADQPDALGTRVILFDPLAPFCAGFGMN